jgi:outer membrane immunogenic protein
MKKLLLPALALLAVSAGGALAADLPIRKAPAMVAPAPVYSWTGCYIGGGGGYGLWNQENQTFDAVGPLDELTTNGGRGWFGTVQVGCDYQFAQNWVVGVFGDYDFADLKGHMSYPVNASIGREKLKDAWAVGGRVGYLILPQLLTYVSGGYTEARFGAVHFYDDTFGGPDGVHVNGRTYSGWFIGSGYEYGLNFLLPGLFWKTEYRFSSYDGERNPVIDTPTGTLTGDVIHSEKWVQTIRSELVWRWNWGGTRW